MKQTLELSTFTDCGRATGLQRWLPKARAGSSARSYASTASLVMLVQPLGVIQGVLDSVLRVRNLVLAGLLLVTAACLLLVIFIFSLTFRLRHSEFDSLARLELREVWFGIYAVRLESFSWLAD